MTLSPNLLTQATAQRHCRTQYFAAADLRRAYAAYAHTPPGNFSAMMARPAEGDGVHLTCD